MEKDIDIRYNVIPEPKKMPAMPPPPPMPMPPVPPKPPGEFLRDNGILHMDK